MMKIKIFMFVIFLSYKGHKTIECWRLGTPPLAEVHICKLLVNESYNIEKKILKKKKEKKVRGEKSRPWS